MPEKSGQLRIVGERGGTITEVTRFLRDTETAYLALYDFALLPIPYRLWRRIPPEVWLDFGYPLDHAQRNFRSQSSREAVPPSARLTLERVRIESPGWWVVAGALNPLQQIREYLNDRHRRRQDREFREESEKERLALENELLRAKIVGQQNTNLQDRLTVIRGYREFGFSDDEIDRLLWAQIGVPLSRRGRHQDAHLIGGAEIVDEDVS